ncbi:MULTISPECIES: peptidoglycan-binding protein [Rhodomicrobium]|uniref:peptidoglycan-binding protein n=1 Tax=Rhodomicrobium TaxID=1068 RepID=UPI000B4B25E3|nr:MULTISPECIES: peptidoglycan-binding protein [Rhodomicrobium]
MQLTESAIRALFPDALDSYVSALTRLGPQLENHGMLSNPLHLAHFLAQCAAESGGFSLTSESGNYSAERLLEIFPKYFTPAQARAYARKPKPILSRAYAGRLGNGPEASGEGWIYRGRGPLQETGKDNYRRAGAELGIDLVADPDSAAYPPIGFQIALNRWSRSKLNSYAGRGPTHAAILACSRGINLGNPLSRAQPNGFAERKAWFEKIWAVLGDQTAAAKINPLADGILEEGEEGEAVAELQRALAGLGYPVGTPDGVFSERTHAAVAAFQAREALPGDLGKWRLEWNDRLKDAAPFENTARRGATPTDLEAKGDELVGWLGWLQKAAAGAAAFLGLDQAVDVAGLQLPETLTGMRQVVDPLSANLIWLLGNKWAFGILACIGLIVLASWLRRRQAERHRNFVTA